MIRSLIVFLTLTTFIACEDRSEKADLIIYGGSIISMTGPTDVYSGIAVKDGLIQQIGDEEFVLGYKSADTKMINLNGRSVIPGFIDAHSHFMIGAQMADWVNVSSPPVGNVGSIDALVDKIGQHIEDNKIQKGTWVTAWGYDPDLLTESRHPTRYDVDKLIPDHPVVLRHVSGHLAVLNSLALELVGYSAETADPQGGKIYRLDNSPEPNGLISESALHAVLEHQDDPNQDQWNAAIKKTSDLYSSNGYTTANDGFTSKNFYQIISTYSQADTLPLDLISALSITDVWSILEDGAIDFGEYSNRLKIAGVKLITDGSPQGKTARMSQPYDTEVPGCVHDCRGISVMTEDQMLQSLAQLYKMGVQVFAHCNGDEAIENFIKTHRQVVDSLQLDTYDHRTTVIHSQFMRPYLLADYQDTGLIPSYFTNHTFFWGDVHVANLGVDRAFFTSPMKSSIEADIMHTNHTDYPITPLDPMMMLWSSTNRISRTNQIIGPQEKISMYEALKALTINAAYQYREESKKGSLEIGKLADLVILSANPLEMGPMNIRDISIDQTIKEGRTIYSREL